MATSRFDEEQLGARPRRDRRLPGHLDDFFLTYPTRQPDPVFPNITSSTPVQQTSTPAYTGARAEVSPEIERLRRMERCVTQVQDQVREIQSTLQASLHLGRGASQLQPLSQTRSLSLPVLANPALGSLENVPPLSPIAHNTDSSTIQQTSPSTVQQIDIPPTPQSTVPTLTVATSTALPPVYISSSVPATGTPVPVVSRSVFTVTDQPHPPW